RGIKLRSGDEVVGSVVVEEDCNLLTLCAHGFGKRTGFAEYRRQSRGGLGIINIQANDRNGPVVAVAAVREQENIMLITAGGMMVRTRVAEISVIGRNTQGVRVVNPKKGDRLLAAAVVSGEDDPGEATPDETPENSPEAPQNSDDS
ncbi:MAG: DNA gyrase C-terminal beta-propeller domain-containing protein, partial [Planctomycetota bacterium]